MNLQRQMLLLIITLGALIRCATPASAVTLPLEQMAVPERRFDIWGPLSLDVQQELRMLLEAGPEEVDRLLSSADPREIGLGLFVLEQNADLERLVSLVNLLDDARPTIPCAAPTATNHFIPQQQTVGEYIAHIYANWFGIPAEDSPARRGGAACKEAVRNLGEPWARPIPWLQKMQRATRAGRNRYDDHAVRGPLVIEVKAEVAALPSEIRWAIITQGRSRGDYSQDEARAALLALDQPVRDQIMAGNPLESHAGQIGWNLDKDLAVVSRELLLTP